MCQAKYEGKAYYTAAGAPSINNQALKRLELEGDLRRAIERNEFRVYYQPEILLENGRIVGMEALVRWEHPELGLLFPSEFIPVAEETGLIIPIGRLVFELAGRQARAWRELCPGVPRPIVWVNLSAKQFRQPNLVDEVAEVLQNSGLDPSGLGLEITESVVMEDAPATSGTLLQLKDVGVRLAIDDFGTGYSSMSYLKRFPVDYLKIDRSFVDNLKEEGTEDEVIMSGMIGLAHGLGLKVIAEGVDTAGQLVRLRELGCEIAQGYYFSEPLAAESLHCKNWLTDDWQG
jgi:EAL domain-containing protein (putative c-di-GMP-specific phosphodiesterase class I)